MGSLLHGLIAQSIIHPVFTVSLTLPTTGYHENKSKPQRIKQTKHIAYYYELNLILCLHNIGALGICMKKFNAKNNDGHDGHLVNLYNPL